MVNGFRYYRALESVSIAPALSTALTIYPCQIRVHQRGQSKLQLPTARKKEWRPATAGSSPPCGYLSNHRLLVGGISGHLVGYAYAVEERTTKSSRRSFSHRRGTTGVDRVAGLPATVELARLMINFK